MKKKQDDGRKYGKVSGCEYQVRPDGSIQLAPAVFKTIEDLMDHQDGVDRYAASVHEFMSKQHEKLLKDLKGWWNRLVKDIKEVEGCRERLVYNRGGVVTIRKGNASPK